MGAQRSEWFGSRQWCILNERARAVRMQVAIEADMVGSDDRSRTERAPLRPDRAWHMSGDAHTGSWVIQ